MNSIIYERVEEEQALKTPTPHHSLIDPSFLVRKVEERPEDFAIEEEEDDLKEAEESYSSKNFEKEAEDSGSPARLP